MTPGKPVNASIIHRVEIEQGTGHPGTTYSGTGQEAENSVCEDLAHFIICLTQLGIMCLTAPNIHVEMALFKHYRRNVE